MFSNLKQNFNTPNTSFGFSSNVTQNPFGQSTFGKTPSTGFGTPAPAFGQQATPLFGQASQHGSLFASAAPTNTFGQPVNTQPTFGSGMFGNASSQPSGSGLFGAANTSTFGQQNKTTGFGFGANTANTGFGFGQTATQVQPQQQSTGLFGQGTSNLFGQSSGFGANTANNQIGTVIKFTPVTGTDTMIKGSINQTISTRHHCITCMKEYENKSLEELRWEDYQVNRKGPQQGAQPAGGLFGNMSQPVGAPLFGSGAVATSANTLFGQQENKSVFGQPATATGLWRPDSRIPQRYESQCDSQVDRGSSQQAYECRPSYPQQSQFVDYGQQCQVDYGQQSQVNYEPQFGGYCPQIVDNAQQQQFCNHGQQFVDYGYGPQYNPYYDPGFGQTTPAFGATPTSNTGGGLFGKPLTGFGTATTSSAFPFSSQPQSSNLFGTNTAAKPAFGVSSQPNSLFGQPSGFGNQSSGFGSFGATTNQNVGLFNQNKTTPFSIMPTSTTNTFGSFAAPAAQNTNSLFSGAKPNTGGFGGFGQTSTAPVFGQPSFGQANQGGLFNSSFNKTATPLFGQTQTTNTLGTGLQMGGGNTLFGSNVNKPNTMFGNNLGLFNSGFGTNTNPGTFNLGGTGAQQGVPNQDQNQINSEQQIISMSSTPYGIPSLLNNISEVSNDLKDCTRPTNPSELNALLNTVTKPQAAAPAEKLKPVQVFGRKVPMFDGLEHRDESLISNIRINNNPKRLIVRNHPSKSKDSLDDSLIRCTTNPLILDSDLANLSNRSLIEDEPKEKESANLYPDLKSLQKELSPVAQKNNKNLLSDISITSNLPISSTMITSPSKALFLPETTTNDDDNDSREEDGDFFAEASESQDWQTEHNDSIRGVTESAPNTNITNTPTSALSTSHPTGIILTRSEYYTVPSLDELVKYISEDGSCVVKGFTVGRYGYGNVYFSDAFDVSNLNLDELVHFRHKEINIYPDDSKKPPQGQGLNRKAQVTLDKVWPLDKKAKALVTDVENLTKMDYAGRLRRLCEKQNTRFVEYRPDTGSWVFKVEHFSKYGHRDSDDEEDELGNAKKPEKGIPTEGAVTSKTDSKTTTTPVSTVVTVTTTAPTISSFTTVSISPKNSLDLREIVDIPISGVMEDEDMFSDLVDYESSYSSPRYSIMNGMGKCSLMKSTFFEQEMDYDDNASDVCSSEGGILELSNYVSKSSPKRKESPEDFDDSCIPESEYIPLDICEDDEVPEPIDKPEIAPLDEVDVGNDCSRVDTYNNVADILAFKGKSFRVGWTKQSTMLCLERDELITEDTNDDEPTYHTVAVKKLTNLKLDDFQNLEKHLECQFTNSSNDDKNGIPHSFSFYGNSKLQGHQDIAKKLSKDNYEKQIWDLMATLFDYPEEDNIFIERNEIYRSKIDQARKLGLTKWIKPVVESSVDREVNNTKRSDLSKILSYISGNKIDEAAELAMKSKNINLAMLISQMPTSALAQIALKTQLSLWEKCDVYDFLDETVLKIYTILSGSTMVKARGNTILVYEGMDWIRIFALYFWYVIKGHHPLSDAVHMYEQMFQEYKLAIPPLPDYEGAPENIYDLRYQLLKYYSDNGHPVTHLFNTFTYTNDPLDYRLSWFVFQTLHSLGQEQASKHARHHMHINFATQLEQMGLWHWAIYILTYIDDNFLKKEIIIDMLGRHVQLRGEETKEYKKRERMLIEKFRICPDWVENEKAIKAEQTQCFKDAVYYLCYAKEWKRANDLLMRYYVPEHLLSYDYEYLIELLTPLSEHKELLPDWEEAGGLILDFAKLGIQYNRILSLNDPVAIKKQLISFRSSVINVSVRFKHFTPLTYLHDVCLAEMSGRIAVMLRKLLTVINGHTYELCVDTAINAQTLPMTTDYLKQELNSILIDFLDGNQPKMIYL